MTISKKLLSLVCELSQYDDSESESADTLAESAENVGKSWSGSWFGYHSKVYYKKFASPPPGAAFS